MIDTVWSSVCESDDNVQYFPVVEIDIDGSTMGGIAYYHG